MSRVDAVLIQLNLRPKDNYQVKMQESSMFFLVQLTSCWTNLAKTFTGSVLRSVLQTFVMYPIVIVIVSGFSVYMLYMMVVVFAAADGQLTCKLGGVCEIVGG